jgi:hypothetical protein
MLANIESKIDIEQTRPPPLADIEWFLVYVPLERLFLFAQRF